jgi:6-phosphogluconolactonase (cycloisomerase 2 family)
MSGRGPNPSRQEAPHPHMTAIDPTGAFIIVPDLGADLLRIYSIARDTGFITSCANITAAAGSGPRHVAFWETADGEGTMMYLGNELGNDLTVYSVAYPTEEGACLSLFEIQTKTPYPTGQVVVDGQKVGEVRTWVSYPSLNLHPRLQSALKSTVPSSS